MGTGREFYNACCSFEGQRYSTAPGRTDPNSNHKDCSGMVAAGFEVVQGYELGAYVSSTIFHQSVQAGLEIPYEYGLQIVGSLLFKPDNPYQGLGPAGHIAVNDARGGTIEATPPRVQRLPLSYNAPWSPRSALLIDIDYSNYGEGTPVIIPEPIPEEEDEEMKSFLIVARGGVWVYNPNTHTAKPFDTPETLETWKNIFRISYVEEPVTHDAPGYVALLEDALRPLE